MAAGRPLDRRTSGLEEPEDKEHHCNQQDPFGVPGFAADGAGRRSGQKPAFARGHHGSFSPEPHVDVYALSGGQCTSEAQTVGGKAYTLEDREY